MSWWPCPPWATRRTTCSPWRSRSRRSPNHASWTCCSRPASASPCRCFDRHQRARMQGGVLHRFASGDHHRHAARGRAHRRDPPETRPRVARRGERRHRRRLPGALHELRHHDARPGWIRHDRGRHGRGGRRGGLRDLHRRSGRVHRRSADRAERTQGGRHLVRGDARARGRRHEGPERPVGGVRSKARREAPRPLVVRRRAGHMGAGGRRAAHGRRPDLGCGPRQRRGEGDARPRAGPAGSGGHGLPRRGRRGHQRRHDRAERVARRRDRPLLHRAPRRRSPSGDRDGAGREGDRRPAVLDRRRHLEGVARGAPG